MERLIFLFVELSKFLIFLLGSFLLIYSVLQTFLILIGYDVVIRKKDFEKVLHGRIKQIQINEAEK